MAAGPTRSTYSEIREASAELAKLLRGLDPADDARIDELRIRIGELKREFAEPGLVSIGGLRFTGS